MNDEATEDTSDDHGDANRGVYSISVTADMVGTGVQNLRSYEAKGLLEPTRSPGGTRLYSANDVRRLNRITSLLADGLNLAGVALVLDLQDDNNRLRKLAARPARRASSTPQEAPDKTPER